MQIDECDWGIACLGILANLVCLLLKSLIPLHKPFTLYRKSRLANVT